MPSPAGEAIDLLSSHILYDLGSSMRWQPLKKTVSFWANIYKGNTRLKVRFFANKILRVLGLQVGGAS